MSIPHKILINNQMIGIMKTPEVTINLPAGMYLITIQSIVPLLSASSPIMVNEDVLNVLAFHDREKIWDSLFVIDIILWCADFFFTLPHPWGLVYKIFTNGYFVLWLIYEWIIRKKYFRIETYASVERGE